MTLLVRLFVALVVMGLGIALLIKYDLAIVLYKMLLIAWHWLLSFKLVAKIYMLRQIMSPFWRIVTRGLITVFGIRLLGVFKSKLTLAVDFTKEQLDRWRKLPFWIRWGIFTGSLAAIGIFGFGIYVLPIWIPFLQPVFRKLHMWWFDTIATRWLRPARMKLRYTFRNNPVLVILRMPHRVAFYFILIGIRKAGRFCKSAFVRT